jgi:hypothetical protein
VTGPAPSVNVRSAQPDPVPRVRQRNIAYVYAGKDTDSRLSAAKRLAVMLANFMPGKKLKITVEPDHAKRSDLQNRALWGCAYRHLEEQSGNEPEDLHEYFCGEFWGWKKVEVMGQWRKRPIRTTTKNEHGDRDVIPTLLMAEFYEFIQRRSAEVGFDVPDPDPDWFLKEAKAA